MGEGILSQPNRIMSDRSWCENKTPFQYPCCIDTNRNHFHYTIYQCKHNHYHSRRFTLGRIRSDVHLTLTMPEILMISGRRYFRLTRIPRHFSLSQRATSKRNKTNTWSQRRERSQDRAVEVSLGILLRRHNSSIASFFFGGWFPRYWVAIGTRGWFGERILY